jgi:hypothetical protein
MLLKEVLNCYINLVKISSKESEIKKNHSDKDLKRQVWAIKENDYASERKPELTTYCIGIQKITSMLQV